MDIILKAQVMKEEIDKLNFLKIKHFCLSKEPIHRIERQLTEWEEIFANCISDKGLISDYIDNF